MTSWEGRCAAESGIRESESRSSRLSQNSASQLAILSLVYLVDTIAPLCLTISAYDMKIIVLEPYQMWTSAQFGSFPKLVFNGDNIVEVRYAAFDSVQVC
jgi:hypothetical protein